MRDATIKKVAVIGSGPIIIGQAAEFDYAGTQACRALREEGVSVVLLNSNPATIMTDRDIADRVYIEPLTEETLKALLLKERPDSLLATLGGQAGLNLAMALWEEGFLQEQGIRIIGTGAEAIRRAEDRLLFKEAMERCGEPVAASEIVHSVEEGLKAAAGIGYPVVLRPAYTLGGSGGGIAADPDSCAQILETGLRLSRVHEVLVERSIAGWKEIEYEVVRDGAGGAVTVCNMENVDPVGVHTGDSIVVAPSQTLSDPDHQMLRSAALRIVHELEIRGACNVQFALHPDSREYCVIEVNPRVSRSSALASKATGYPIARVSARIALGYRLDEIRNTVTGNTTACFEPMLDYCVVKMPRLPFDKFHSAQHRLGTQMKATGEVMAISDSFEGALMKAVRSLEQHTVSLLPAGLAQVPDQELRGLVVQADDRRLWAVAELLRRGVQPEEIRALTQIDLWFLDRIRAIVEMEQRLRDCGQDRLPAELLRAAKRMEFPDRTIAALTGRSEEAVRTQREESGIVPSYRMVDTCAAEFEAATPYFYSVYGVENEACPLPAGRRKVLIVGSGPIRIGQGIEFDFCSVHCTWAFRKEGWETIIVNNNPETVSTDFDIADRLYFEPLTAEDLRAIVAVEQPDGAVVQFGGQTAIGLTRALMEMGVEILGTSADDVDAAEDRERFDRILEETGIRRPAGKTVFTVEEAVAAAEELGFPVLVRPSYVLGGAGMRIAVDSRDIVEYVGMITQVRQEHPILVDKYIRGTEAEVDAVCNGKEILIPGIMEHIERTGIHSGDSISVYPPRTLTPAARENLVRYTEALARALHVRGMINIQFIACGDEVYIIEVNPRSSRTVPYISKVTGIPVIPLAVGVLCGHSIRAQGYAPGLQPEAALCAVKMPVFSFEKLQGADTTLGPEMKSTGECLGVSPDYHQALYKAFLGAGMRLPQTRKMIITVRDRDKEEILPVARAFRRLGYQIYATAGTAQALRSGGVACGSVRKAEELSPNILDLVLSHEIDLVIDTPHDGAAASRDGFRIRRIAVETGVHVLSAVDTAAALAEALLHHSDMPDPVDLAHPETAGGAVFHTDQREDGSLREPVNLWPGRTPWKNPHP